MPANPTTPPRAGEDINFGHKTHYDEAVQALFYMDALFTLLSLTDDRSLEGRDGTELSITLESVGRLGMLLRQKALAEVDEMEQERRRRAGAANQQEGGE
jgi:hypothetical protein